MEGRLVAGGGLFVGSQGLVTDDHFVLGKGARHPEFSAGPRSVAICARAVGEKTERRLHEVGLQLTEEQAAGLNDGRAGVGFERSPDSDRFHAAIEPFPTPQGDRPVPAAPTRVEALLDRLVR